MIREWFHWKNQLTRKNAAIETIKQTINLHFNSSHCSNHQHSNKSRWIKKSTRTKTNISMYYFGFYLLWNIIIEFVPIDFLLIHVFMSQWKTFDYFSKVKLAHRALTYVGPEGASCASDAFGFFKYFSSWMNSMAKTSTI